MANRALLKFVMVTPRGAKFVHAIDTETSKKDGNFVCAKLIDVIENIESSNVVQVCMVGAAVNSKAMKSLIMLAKYPHTMHTN